MTTRLLLLIVCFVCLVGTVYSQESISNRPRVTESSIDTDFWKLIENDEDALTPTKLQDLVDQGFDIQGANGDGVTPIMVVARDGRSDTCEFLLKLGADPNTFSEESERSYPPLLFASARGDVNIVRALLEHGANPNLTKADTPSALFIACSHGFLEVYRILRSFGASIGFSSPDGVTPLLVAAQNGHLPLVRALIEDGTTIDTLDDSGETALLAAARGNHFEILKELINAGANLDTAAESGDTPLSCAAAHNDSMILRFLVDNGASVEGGAGSRALCGAIAEHNSTGALLLISKVPDLDHSEICAPLVLSIEHGSLELIDPLLSRGVDPQSCNAEGVNALRAACKKGYGSVVEKLIEHGADVNVASLEGVTPLMCASQSGSLSIVQLLLQTGARVNDIDQHGRNALHYAASEGQISVALVLIEAGVDTRHVDSSGSIPFLSAAEYGHADVVELLLGLDAQGVNDALSSDGSNVFGLATRYGQADVLRALFNSIPGELIETYLASMDPELRESVIHFYKRISAIDNELQASTWIGANANTRPSAVFQSGHTLGLSDVAVSGNGRFVLSGDRGGSLILWDADSGCQVRSIASQFVALGGIAVDKAGEKAYIAGKYAVGGQIVRVDLQSGITEARVQIFESDCTSLALSPDESMVCVGGRTGRIAVLDTSSLSIRGYLLSHAGAVISMEVSPDSKYLASGHGGEHSHATIWRLRDGERVRDIGPHDFGVHALAFSPSGSRMVSADGDENGRIQVWNTADGSRIREFTVPTTLRDVVGVTDILPMAREDFSKFRGRQASFGSKRFSSPISGVGFAGEDTIILGSAEDGSVQTWNIDSGDRLDVGLEHESWVTSLALSRDGSAAITGSQDGQIYIWNSSELRPIQKLSGANLAINEICLSPDNHFLATAHADGTLQIWDLDVGALHGRTKISDWAANCLDIFPDNQRVVVGDGNGELSILDIDDLSVKARGRIFPDNTVGVSCVRVSSDGQFIVAGSMLGFVVLDSDDLHELYRPRSGSASQRFGLLRDDESLVCGGPFSRRIEIWDLKNQRLAYGFDNVDFPSDIALSDAQNELVIAGFNGTLTKCDLPFGMLEILPVASPNFLSCCLSHDGAWALGGDEFGMIHVVDTRANRVSAVLLGQIGAVTSITTSLGDEFAYAGGRDGTIRVWDLKSLPTANSEKSDVPLVPPIATFLANPNGDWAVFDQYDSFDTISLRGNEPIRWRVPGAYQKPMPIELFMRDHFVPRLLSRILSRDHDGEIADFTKLNLAQPEITAIRFEKSRFPSRVTILLDVRSTNFEIDRNGALVNYSSGVYDVRLLREGQLVGQYPVNDESRVRQGALGEELDAWRKSSKIKTKADGTATIRFDDVRIPHSGLDGVAFTAYAFNEDRVKSITSEPTIFKPSTDFLPPDETSRHKAYLVGIGIEEYESPNWNLVYAADDADQMIENVSSSLKRVGQYDVVPIQLISGETKNQFIHARTRPTKKAIKMTIERLADVVTPDDVALFFWSGHGYADKTSGEFYLLPYDIGLDQAKGASLSSSFLARCISSTELSHWLRSVDARQIVLVVDACYAAASVDEPGFKPGPMGNLGFGQLAYDKRMRILAATQADDFALELPDIQHGLLTYALLEQGLINEEADYRPTDNKIDVGEWLSFAVISVPLLYEKIRTGELKSAVLDTIGTEPSFNKNNAIQQPQLFDYANTDLVLANRVKRSDG